jgi:hypothetical protein
LGEVCCLVGYRWVAPSRDLTRHQETQSPYVHHFISPQQRSALEKSHVWMHDRCNHARPERVNEKIVPSKHVSPRD